MTNYLLGSEDGGDDFGQHLRLSNSSFQNSSTWADVCGYTNIRKFHNARLGIVNNTSGNPASARLVGAMRQSSEWDEVVTGSTLTTSSSYGNSSTVHTSIWYPFLKVQAVSPTGGSCGIELYLWT